MADKLPFMPFYGADFFGDERVRLMDRTEQAVYLELLWHQWREGSLPIAREDLERLVRDPVGPKVLECLPVCEDRRRRNPRVETIRAQHMAKLKGRSDAGKKGRATQLAATPAEAPPKQSPGKGRAKAGQSPDKRQPTAGQSESESDTEVKATTATPADAGDRAPGDPGRYEREAVQIYAAHIGLIDYGRMRKVLRPAIQAFGSWEAVRPWFEAYCALRPYRRANGTFPQRPDEAEKDTRFCSPEEFVRTITEWRELVETPEVAA